MGSYTHPENPDYMRKHFNTTGLCYPEEHYMVNIDKRLAEIRVLVDQGQYFVINRARQYGKTTTISLLIEKLAKQYAVFSISFEGIEDDVYASSDSFCRNFYNLLNDEFLYHTVNGIPNEIRMECESRSTGITDRPGMGAFRHLFPKCAKKLTVQWY